MLSATPVFAEHGGSVDDQIACTPDVYRLCTQFIPNEDAIVACLQKNKPALSPACQKVFSPPPAGSKPDESSDD
jgi:hypothetical protein